MRYKPKSIAALHIALGGSDPPSHQRGITISSIYPRGRNSTAQTRARLGDGQLEIPIAASYRLGDAAQALAQATGGHAGGAILMP